MRVETQAKLEGISCEIKKIVADEVFAKLREMFDWAVVQARDHHRLAVESTDAGDETMAHQHSALASAYGRLRDEINVLIREQMTEMSRS